MRPSDSSRPVIASSLRPRRLPPAVFRCGGREASPGKNAELRAKPSPLRTLPDGYRTSLPEGSSPRIRTPYGASLSFDSALHLRLPPDAPSRVFHSLALRALVTSMRGSLRQGPQRTFTSCSAPMPGAPRDASLRSSSPAPGFTLRPLRGLGSERHQFGYTTGILPARGRSPRKRRDFVPGRLEACAPSAPTGRIDPPRPGLHPPTSQEISTPATADPENSQA